MTTWQLKQGLMEICFSALLQHFCQGDVDGAALVRRALVHKGQKGFELRVVMEGWLEER